ncbi:jg22326 [Pararge aegeria aegeria]|uniref:Jg22326 protein n=1 Tax=Pararge aegeria aegeria TaxID=348720 RepID=A0A8S4QRH8_9NEOP|nr:jg22326 [Pararge aegeria aegeria]
MLLPIYVISVLLNIIAKSNNYNIKTAKNLDFDIRVRRATNVQDGNIDLNEGNPKNSELQKLVTLYEAALELKNSDFDDGFKGDADSANTINSDIITNGGVTELKSWANDDAIKKITNNYDNNIEMPESIDLRVKRAPYILNCSSGIGALSWVTGTSCAEINTENDGHKLENPNENVAKEHNSMEKDKLDAFSGKIIVPISKIEKSPSKNDTKTQNSEESLSKYLDTVADFDEQRKDIAEEGKRKIQSQSLVKEEEKIPQLEKVPKPPSKENNVPEFNIKTTSNLTGIDIDTVEDKNNTLSPVVSEKALKILEAFDEIDDLLNIQVIASNVEEEIIFDGKGIINQTKSVEEYELVVDMTYCCKKQNETKSGLAKGQGENNFKHVKKDSKNNRIKRDASPENSVSRFMSNLYTKVYNIVYPKKGEDDNNNLKVSETNFHNSYDNANRNDGYNQYSKPMDDKSITNSAYTNNNNGDIGYNPSDSYGDVNMYVYNDPTKGYKTPINGYQTNGYSALTAVYQTPTSGYKAPTSGYQAPTYGYKAPTSGYQVPTNGYQTPTNDYNTPTTGYQVPANDNKIPTNGKKAPTSGYQIPINGYKTPTNGYQIPAYDYKTPTNGYQTPTNGYKVPVSGYQAPANGYQVPTNGYQTPTNGYQVPTNGYQTPTNGYNTRTNGYQTPTNGYQTPTNAFNSAPTTNNNYANVDSQPITNSAAKSLSGFYSNRYSKLENGIDTNNATNHDNGNGYGYDTSLSNDFGYNVTVGNATIANNSRENNDTATDAPILEGWVFGTAFKCQKNFRWIGVACVPKKRS